MFRLNSVTATLRMQKEKPRKKGRGGIGMSVCFKGVRNDLRILSPSFLCVIPIQVNYYCSSIVIMCMLLIQRYTHKWERRRGTKNGGEDERQGLFCFGIYCRKKQEEKFFCYPKDAFF